MKFMFSGTMLRFVDYASEVEIDESNLERALQSLLVSSPSLKPVLLDGEGRVRRSHQMFLNGEAMDARYYGDSGLRNELALQPNDAVFFLTAIAGG